MTAQVAPHYTKYGHNGFDVFAVGFITYTFNTMKEVKKWCASHGLEIVRL